MNNKANVEELCPKVWYFRNRPKKAWRWGVREKINQFCLIEIELFMRFFPKFGAQQTTGTPIKTQNKKNDFSSFVFVTVLPNRVEKYPFFPILSGKSVVRLISYAFLECTGKIKVFEKKDHLKSSKIDHFTKKKFFSVRKQILRKYNF